MAAPWRIRKPGGRVANYLMVEVVTFTDEELNSMRRWNDLYGITQDEILKAMRISHTFIKDCKFATTENYYRTNWRQ